MIYRVHDMLCWTWKSDYFNNNVHVDRTMNVKLFQLNLNIWLGLVSMPASGHCSWAEGQCACFVCECTWNYVKGCHGHGSGDSIFRRNERNWRIVSVELYFHHKRARCCERLLHRLEMASFKQIPLRMSDFIPAYMLHEWLF